MFFFGVFPDKAVAKVIIGLGNPDPEYSYTRHNAGAQAVRRLAKKNKFVFKMNRSFKSFLAQGKIGGRNVFLFLPQTFMNISGEAVVVFLRKKHIALENILVVYDDVSLPLGELRVRARGSAGGHNGLASVIQKLATKDFARLRIGIGGRAYNDLSTYVLAGFSEDEKSLLNETLDRAVEGINMWVCDGIDKCMHRYNKGIKKPIPCDSNDCPDQ